VCNATIQQLFSVIQWQSVLLVGETQVSAEHQQLVTNILHV